MIQLARLNELARFAGLLLTKKQVISDDANRKVSLLALPKKYAIKGEPSEIGASIFRHDNASSALKEIETQDGYRFKMGSINVYDVTELRSEDIGISYTIYRESYHTLPDATYACELLARIIEGKPGKYLDEYNDMLALGSQLKYIEFDDPNSSYSDMNEYITKCSQMILEGASTKGC